jgi:hypothetical protein
MDQDARLTYAAQSLQLELDPVIKVIVLEKEVWEKEFLSYDDVDRVTGVHKQYGLTAPVMWKGQWTLPFSPWHLIQPMADEDDDRLQRWITYWAGHMFLHLVVLEFAMILGSPPQWASEIETKVEEEFEAQHHELWSFGAQIRMLNPP